MHLLGTEYYTETECIKIVRDVKFNESEMYFKNILTQTVSNDFTPHDVSLDKTVGEDTNHVTNEGRSRKVPIKEIFHVKNHQRNLMILKCIQHSSVLGF